MKDFKLQQFRNIGEILTDSFFYLRLHYKSLAKTLLLLVAPFYLISSIMVGSAYSDFFSALMNNPDVRPESLFTNELMFGLFMLTFSTGALLTASLTHIQLVHENGEAPFSLVFENFGRNFLSLFLLYLLIILGVSFGFFFFILPGIYLGIKMFVAPAISVIEHKNPIDSIIRSWELTTGHWWPTLGVYLVMNIISSIMSYLIIIPFSLILGLLSTAGLTSAESVTSGIGIFYSLLMVIASLFSVLILIAMCLHYFNLIERKEGTGLRSQIESLDS